MTTDRKQFELITPSEAARRLGVVRNTVLYRVAHDRYRSQVHGGVLFVVAEDVEKEVAAQQQAA